MRRTPRERSRGVRVFRAIILGDVELPDRPFPRGRVDGGCYSVCESERSASHMRERAAKIRRGRRGWCPVRLSVGELPERMFECDAPDDRGDKLAGGGLARTQRYGAALLVLKTGPTGTSPQNPANKSGLTFRLTKLLRHIMTVARNVVTPCCYEVSPSDWLCSAMPQILAYGTR